LYILLQREAVDLRSQAKRMLDILSNFLVAGGGGARKVFLNIFLHGLDYYFKRKEIALLLVLVPQGS
jgi:hypothetical protein